MKNLKNIYNNVLNLNKRLVYGIDIHTESDFQPLEIKISNEKKDIEDKTFNSLSMLKKSLKPLDKAFKKTPNDLLAKAENTYKKRNNPKISKPSEEFLSHLDLSKDGQLKEDIKNSESKIKGYAVFLSKYPKMESVKINIGKITEGYKNREISTENYTKILKKTENNLSKIYQKIIKEEKILPNREIAFVSQDILNEGYKNIASIRHEIDEENNGTEFGKRLAELKGVKNNEILFASEEEKKEEGKVESEK